MKRINKKDAWKTYTIEMIGERFWSKVEIGKDDECWTWKSSGNRRPTFRHEGKNVSSSRVAWLLRHGWDIPTGLFACHSCDNLRCVNPNHLWVGDAYDNIHDAMDKGIIDNRKERRSERHKRN